MNNAVQNNELYLNIKNILQSARDNAYRQVNFIMVEAYGNIGKQIGKEKQPLITEAVNNTKDLQLTSKDIIKDPYVLEFLDLKQNNSFYESDLETALIEKIQEFLLELGRGFAFVARQKRIQTETSDFYIQRQYSRKILRFKR